MKATEALAEFYKSTHKLMGPIQAKEALSTAMYLVISDIQNEGLPISAELIEERLQLYIDDFLKVAKKHDAA